MSRTYSDQDLIEALRAAAEATERPLSVKAYEVHQRAVGGPTYARIIQRLGSWNAALARSGLETRAVTRGYARRWDEDQMVAEVRRFLTEGGGSYAAYDAWARREPEAPSAQTVRNHFGGWAAAKERAGGA